MRIVSTRFYLLLRLYESKNLVTSYFSLKYLLLKDTMDYLATAKKVSKTKQLINAGKWLNAAQAKHKGHFDYSEAVYTKATENIRIRCTIHDLTFITIARTHLRGNGGCPECKRDKCTFGQRKTLQEFKDQATERHKGKYSYENSVYINDNTKLLITCPGHGDFLQQAGSHIGLLKCGCPECAKDTSGFRRTRYVGHSAVFYCIAVETVLGLMYKVGITKHTIHRRYWHYKEDLAAIKYVVVNRWFIDGEQAWDLEKAVLRKFSHSKYKGPSPFRDTGITEILTENPSIYIKEQYEKTTIDQT